MRVGSHRRKEIKRHLSEEELNELLRDTEDILSVTSVDRLLRFTRGSNASCSGSVDPAFDGL